MSKPKEPHFFHPDIKTEIKTIDEYEACFAHASSDDIAVGEASPHTFYSSEAIKNILKYQPQAKFIVCLRNPIEMAVSFHNQLVFNGDQGIRDFLEAWNSSAKLSRRHQRGIYPSNKFYRNFCALGTHYRNFSDSLPKERVLTLVLDDMTADITQELRRISDFLGIEIHTTTYPRINIAKQFRSIILKRTVDGLAKVKRMLGLRASIGLAAWIVRANSREDGGAAMLTPQIHAILAEHFQPEIALLESCLSRDLSHWLTPKPTPSDQ